MNQFRSNIGGSFYDQNKMGYSSVSKNYGHSHRSILLTDVDAGYGDDHNMGEVQFMLQNERKKFKQAKEKFEYDLDNERKLRIQFENKLIKLKDEFSRKEVTISELEFKVNNLLHQNQDVIVENERLRSQLARLEELYGGKLYELETQLSLETQNYEDTVNKYNTEFEKFKKEGQQYVQQITFDFERKIKTLEQKSKNSEMAKRDLGLENKKLNDILISNKLTFEQEVRDIKNRARQEEIKKIQNLTKSFEQKLKMIEENKEGIIRKNQELLRLLQDKDRQMQDIEGEKDNEINHLRQDNTDLNQKLNQLNYLISKLKNEITEKDNMIGRSYNQSDHEVQNLKQQLELKKQENIQLASTIRDLRMTIKESEGEWERRRRQLAQRCNILQNQSRKYKQEYQRICEILKSRINDTINTVFVQENDLYICLEESVQLCCYCVFEIKVYQQSMGQNLS